MLNLDLREKDGIHGREQQDSEVAKSDLTRDAGLGFALRIMKPAKGIRMEKKFGLSSRNWLGGTSIGANSEEAPAAPRQTALADFKIKHPTSKNL